MTLKHIFSMALCAMALSGCRFFLDYTPLSYYPEQDSIYAVGAIEATSLRRFKAVLKANPNAKTLVLQYVPGSVDDDANLIFAQYIRSIGFNTYVPSDGLVASGGTDLFLAGVSRAFAPGACVGVHSWYGVQNGKSVQGDKLPRNHPSHQPYLDYYNTVGIPGDFYWFTLQKASSDNLYWMSASEAKRYNMTTAPTKDLGKAADCDTRIEQGN